MFTSKDIRSAIASLGEFMLSQVLGLLLMVAICVGVFIMGTTTSELVFHTVMFGMILLPAVVFLFLGNRLWKKNLFLSVSAGIAGLALTAYYVIATAGRLGWL